MTTKDSEHTPPAVAPATPAAPAPAAAGGAAPAPTGAAAPAAAAQPPAPAADHHAHAVPPPKVLGQVRALHAPGTGSPLAWLLLVAFLAGGAGLAYLGSRASRPPRAAPAVPTVPMVTLQVVSMPPGATVRIDGARQQLAAPSSFQVPRAERLKVQLELEGYAPYEETVAVPAASDTLQLRAVLRPAANDRGRLAPLPPTSGPVLPTSQPAARPGGGSPPHR